jgi:hypothetical protein
MLSFFIVESTNVNNILHGDNKDLLLLLLVLLLTYAVHHALTDVP